MPNRTAGRKLLVWVPDIFYQYAAPDGALLRSRRLALNLRVAPYVPNIGKRTSPLNKPPPGCC
ncbi:MAG: hypothetical protein HUJ22_09925 [Gracilimonas sp.]|uniref:hypothetical protein n=1 Tax=Gracilimonas sp. TaxID=1974203 RepID=UPI00198C579A|nr:hypothetical protein [Gracilimonas sp.]MBD3616879.1 hypothetical protein [Gracilimonas sp.]